MEFYDDWFLGIDWFQYEIMYPDKRRSPYINRYMEINMLQMVLRKGLQKMEPFSLNDFWETTVEQEKWSGKWETFRNHFKDNLGKQVENLIFIPIKFRALILFVTSMRVSDEFKTKLAAEYCECQYDQHGRIVAIRSDENDVVGNGEHRKLRSKDKPKREKEEKEEESEQQVKTIGTLYDKLKNLLDSYFKHKNIAYVLYFGLREEMKEKEASNQIMLVILEKIANAVVKSEDEEMDVPKMGKFDLLLIINSMTSVIPGDKHVKNRIDGMMNVECDRDEYLSLATLGRLIIDIMEE